MARTAQIYELTLAANATETLLVEGGFYKVLAASGDVKIAREGGSAIGPMLPGQGERINFRRLTITNLTASANTVDVLVADDSFVDTRIYGNVQVIDGGRLVTLSNQAYVANTTNGPSVGNYCMHQLWNPPGNTKWASVSRVIVSGYSGGNAFQLRPHNAALVTLGNAPQPKLVNTGASASTMENRYDVAAAIVGGTVLGIVWQAVNAAWAFDFKEPIVLRPGQGLLSVNGNANTPLATNFDFYEFIP